MWNRLFKSKSSKDGTGKKRKFSSLIKNSSNESQSSSKASGSKRSTKGIEGFYSFDTSKKGVSPNRVSINKKRHFSTVLIHLKRKQKKKVKRKQLIILLKHIIFLRIWHQIS